MTHSPLAQRIYKRLLFEAARHPDCAVQFDTTGLAEMIAVSWHEASSALYELVQAHGVAIISAGRDGWPPAFQFIPKREMIARQRANVVPFIPKGTRLVKQAPSRTGKQAGLAAPNNPAA